MKSKTKIILLIFFLMFCEFSFAQIKDSLPKKYDTIYNGDSIRLYNLPDVYIYGALDPTTVDNMQKYYKLRRDIIRAYPYAKLSSAMLKTINDSLAKITSKHDRKKYIKETEVDMKLKFEDELKKLTINQGKVLIKLIDRETGSTSYELVKSYRGVFEAFLWQTTARFFGSSLKETYDPEGQDKVMESIVEAIERGEIPVAKK